jgi:hypothetical protein
MVSQFFCLSSNVYISKIINGNVFLIEILVISKMGYMSMQRIGFNYLSD